MVENLDYRDLLANHDSKCTLFYLDPPYVDKVIYYENSSDFDHDELVNHLVQLEGEFIFSYGKGIPDGLDASRREEMVHPTSNNDRLERLILSFPEEEVSKFDIPTTADPADEW